jgi:ethanolamine utilization microcompartment shell protein EutL
MIENILCKEVEYVGNAPGYTIGLVIANIDPTIRDLINIPSEFSALGIVSTRVGACTQVAAVDDAVKATNTRLVDFELARDSAGYGGPGVTLILGATDIYDARSAVEIALKGVEERMKTLYINEVGHMEIQLSASAGSVLNEIFGAPLNKAFGFMGIGPCGIGLVAADVCVKAAHVEVVWHGRPNYNTPHQNDFITIVSGDYEAVKSCTEAAYDKASKLMATLGTFPKSILEFGK